MLINKSGEDEEIINADDHDDENSVEENAESLKSF